METRNIKITIQQAANWYNSNNDAPLFANADEGILFS